MNAADCTRRLLPLPKSFRLLETRRFLPGAVDVQLPAEAAPPLVEGQRLLREALGPAVDGPGPRVTIELVLLGQPQTPPDPQLADLPNSRQAYRIRSTAPERIVITGAGPEGVFYGAVTLAQLLAGAESAGDGLELPFVEVLDWPDIEQRGLWNFPDETGWVPWLASMKLNFGKMAHTRLAPVQRDGGNEAAIEAALMHSAARLGFHYLPFILHLNFLRDAGLYRAYPELAGVGDGALAGRYPAHKEGDQHRAPCASQSALVDVLTRWMDSIARQGADEISCWLSERPCQCACERCAPVGQFLLEARAFLRAWQGVRQDHPGLIIRIFSSTTTPQQDAAILSELPAEVRFERACATSMERFDHRPRDLFANPLLDRAAAGGRWIASYDVPIGAYGNVDTPETKLPQFSAQRIGDFVSQLHARGYAGAYGMIAWATQAREICGFAIAALAEYAWNTGGRPAAAFAEAWALREGLPDPEAVGRWAELLGEVEFDVYDGGFPTGYTWGRLADAVERGEPPRFGQGLFRHFPDEGAFADRLERVRRARSQLQADAHEPLRRATDVIGGLVELADALWRVAHLHAHGELAEPAVQRRLGELVAHLDAAGDGAVEAIRRWRRHLGPEPWHPRVHDAIAALGDTTRRVGDHVRHCHLDLA